MKQRAYLIRILLAAGLLLTSSCQTTGGDFLGFFPLPKFLSGSIDDGIYQPKDKSFKVWAPFSDATDRHDKYKWTWAEVSEIQYENESLVRFAPIFEDTYTAGIVHVEGNVPTVDQLIRDDEAILETIFPGIQTKIMFSGRSSIRPEMGLVAFTFEGSKSHRSAAALYLIVQGNKMGNLRITNPWVSENPEAVARAFREEKNPTVAKFIRSFEFTSAE